jgi:chromosome segregation ATPase
MKKGMALGLLVAMGSAMLSGCGGSGPDETRPMDQIKAEVEQFDLARLEKEAAKYVQAITAKQADLEKVAAKLKEIPMTELMGDDAKAVKDELASIKDSVSALKARLDVYAQKIKELGGDVSGLKL